MSSIPSMKTNDFSANNILSIAKKAPETKVTRSYTNVIASVTETACFAYSGLSAVLLSLTLIDNEIAFEDNEMNILLIGIIVAPFIGSIASQFANPKTSEKEAANLSKKPMNINRMVTRGAFSVAASSVVSALFFWSGVGSNSDNGDLLDALSGAWAAGIAIGSFSALVEKYAFKR